MAAHFTAYLADAPGGASRVKLAGEFDIAGRELADEVLASAGGARKIVLDLSDLEFIDSMGIHFVVTAHQAAEAEGREFRIVRGGPAGDPHLRPGRAQRRPPVRGRRLAPSGR